MAASPPQPADSPGPGAPHVSTEPDLARRQRDLDRWRSRSRSIHFWRRALPVVIVVIAVGLAAWIGGRSIMARLAAPAKQSQSPVIRMVNPRFYGRDTHDRAFVVGAGQATRDSHNSGVIVMNSPTVTMDAEGPAQTHVQATNGVYHEAGKSMDLQGDVLFTDATGNTFATPRAVVDTKAGTVNGDQGVKGHGPLGQIAASSYGVYDNGKRIVFRGRVHAVIDQASPRRRRK
jgi:lipopolysaccharide export system protein LptC